MRPSKICLQLAVGTLVQKTFSPNFAIKDLASNICASGWVKLATCRAWLGKFDCDLKDRYLVTIKKNNFIVTYPVGFCCWLHNNLKLCILH